MFGKLTLPQVHQKVLLVYGQIGDAYRYSSDGTLTVYHTQDSFPSTTWPVKESHFKALVHLSPGPNKIRFDYVPSKTTQHTVHSSSININYLPLTNSPPLQLAIVLADDSTGKFDAGPEKDIPEGSHLDLAIRKFRMAAYLWQAFTGEQMYRNNFGRRCFRFEEEWQTGTLSSRDTELEIMRNEARVHIIRVKGQIGTMRRHREDFLNDVLSRAIADYFNPQPGQTQHVSALYLDTQWNNERMEIMGNIATGRSEGNVKMAIFNSAALHSYPSCIEEVVPAFTDSFRLDKTCVSSDCGTSWEAASAYIGAHLRETGRLLGCCPRDSGIMSPDYLHFNRTFTTWEPYSVRTSTPGRRCLKEDECGWHRLDVLRFRFHPLFRLPSDAQVPDDSVEVWPVDKDKILVTSGSGVAFVEIFVDGNTSCAGLIEYVNADAGNCAIPRQVTLTAEGVRHQLPPDLKKAKMIKLVIYSGKLRYHVVEDMSQLKTKRCIVKISKNQAAYRGRLVGSVQADGTAPEDLILECATIQTKLLMSIKVYLDGSVADCVTGIEFCYEDSMSQLFGKKSEQPTVQEFTLGKYLLASIGNQTHADSSATDTRRGEILMGFFLKFDKFLQGVQILTSLGRKSRVFGKAKGGIR